MQWKLFSVSCLVLFPNLGFAQADPEPKDGKVTIPITLHPTPAPVPLFKLHLYPEYSDLQPGNRVQGLLKVFMEQDNFFRTVGNEEWQKNFDCPLSEFKMDVGNIGGIAYPNKYTQMGGYLDRGARYKSIEWNEYFELRKDGFYLLLPEVQKMRSLATVLRMRLRGEVKRGEFDKAIVSIQSLFGLAQALEQYPCLIGFLVAAAIAEQARVGLEEMIQQPGCPNLFWAITDIPQPVLSLRTAVGGERLFVVAQYEKMIRTDRILTEKEIDEFLDELNDLLKLEDQRGGLDTLVKNAKFRFAMIAADTARIDAARKRLVQQGAKPEIIKDMSIIQIAIIDDFHRYEILRDDFFKAYHLPHYQAAPWIAQTEDLMKKSKAKGDIIGPALLPAVWKVKSAQVRLDQRFAMLRVTEAIRLHAFENGGKLPASLDEIKLPLSNDPTNGKPFTYAVKDGVATLSGADTKSGERANRIYEIRLK